MIRIAPPPEPDRFRTTVSPAREPLARRERRERSAGRVLRPFVIDLCRGFHNRCGDSAMWDLNGTIDHYRSRKNHRSLCYEWSNFRYVAGWLNSSKQALDQQVLDPFAVRDEWFEVVLPSLVMCTTNCIPVRSRSLAEFTLRRLQLDDGDRIYEQRRIYYESFQNGNHPITWLEEFAPILATAVRRERILLHVAESTSISVDTAAAVCETSRARARELLHAWVCAGHSRSEAAGVRPDIPGVNEPAIASAADVSRKSAYGDQRKVRQRFTRVIDRAKSRMPDPESRVRNFCAG